MIGHTPPDAEQVLASIAERQRDMLMAGRSAMLEALDAYVQTADAFAESQEKLAAASDIEWLNRLLRAQAGFTRDVVDAAAKFARDVTDA